MTTRTRKQLEPAASPLDRLRKLLAARGVVAIGFGVVLLAWPKIGLATMATLVGVFTLASGLVSGIAAYAVPADAREHRVWLVGDAIASYAVGMAVLLWPDLSASALLYALAIWGIAVGGFQLGAAVLLPQGDVRSGLLWLSGVVIAVFGFVIFAAPGAGAVSLLSLVAAFAIVSGLFDVALAVDLRRTTGEPAERSAQPLRAKPAGPH